jgi:hypothetical protein
MSETETHEPDVPGVADVPEPDQEPHEPIPDEADQAEEEEEHEHEQPTSEPAAKAQTMGDDPKAVQKLRKQVRDERDRHAKRLGDILGDAATDTLPCPLCFDGLMGFVLPMDAGNLSDEQKAAVLAFVGEDMGSELRDAEGVVMCDRCDGHGQLKYPSRNPHTKTQQCPKCAGQGFVLAPQPVTAVPDLPPAPVPTFTQQNGQVGPCPLCGAPNSAGRPHFCNPVAQPVG